MKITLYGKPKCVQCDYTERELNKLGIEFDKIDLTEDDASLARLKALGYASAPVVEINGEPKWAGFRPDLIKKLEVSNV